MSITQTPQIRLNWHILFELLEREKPKVDNLQVFGCGAYIHIPQVVCKDKMSPKSKLMTYIGITLGGHRNILCTHLEILCSLLYMWILLRNCFLIALQGTGNNR